MNPLSLDPAFSSSTDALLEMEPELEKPGASFSDAGSLSKLNESPPPVLSADIIGPDPKIFKRERHDPDAIATQPSVFDEPDGVELYGPPAHYENTHRFDADFRWTWREEGKVTRKIDIRIFLFSALMMFCLELDRSNIQQANSDNFLQDLGLTTADYNLGNTVFKASFLAAELPSQLVSKWVGPDRWIPAQLVLWSVVSSAQYKLSGRSSFLACRALLGILQGGFIPESPLSDLILFLSYFYTNGEMPIRMAGLWTSQYMADIVSAFLAIGLFHIADGERGGWRYMFLIEGLLTLVVGIAAFFLMPAGPTQTKTWFRPHGYFNEREEKIIVNKVLRDSPTKSSMHNRQRMTLTGLWTVLCDYHLWPLYIIGVLYPIPGGPVSQYLTLSLKSLGFSTTLTNVLTVPAYVLNIIFLISLTWISERYKKRSLLASTEVFWCIPFLAALITFKKQTSQWAKYVVTMLIVGHPYSHAIQVAWVSRNANGVGGRTVSAALYNMFVQAAALIYSNIYQPGDAPLYHTGNSVLLGIACFTFVFYFATWYYYAAINRHRERKWSSMTPEERKHYVQTTRDTGSRRLDFRFAT